MDDGHLNPPLCSAHPLRARLTRVFKAHRAPFRILHAAVHLRSPALTAALVVAANALFFFLATDTLSTTPVLRAAAAAAALAAAVSFACEKGAFDPLAAVDDALLKGVAGGDTDEDIEASAAWIAGVAARAGCFVKRFWAMHGSRCVFHKAVVLAVYAVVYYAAGWISGRFVLWAALNGALAYTALEERGHVATVGNVASAKAQVVVDAVRPAVAAVEPYYTKYMGCPRDPAAAEDEAEEKAKEEAEAKAAQEAKEKEEAEANAAAAAAAAAAAVPAKKSRRAKKSTANAQPAADDEKEEFVLVSESPIMRPSPESSD